ncbi:MAG TPA: TolC family protein [Desulfosalsimonadaceae bacterium]|nr:TolC family protein [Desulfosalsimonadaceae bacterium]
MALTHKTIYWAGAGLILLMLVTGQARAEKKEQKTPFTLEQAYQTALQKNEQVAISAERLTQEKQDIAVATSNLYPQLSAEAGYTRQKVTEISAGDTSLGSFGNPRDYGTLTLKLEQHIYQWGKVWSGRKIAEYYFESSKFRHIRRVKEILFNVSTRYYEVLLGRRAIEIAKNAVERAEKQLAQAQARFEVGVLTQTDVLRARVQVASSQEDLERAKNQYDIALENLALELGLEAVPDELTEPAEKTFTPVAVADLYQTALTNRKDLKQAEKEVRVAEKRVDFEQADYFPNISVEGSYTQTDESDLFFGEDDDWQATLKLSYPLFTGWRTTAEVDKAKSGLSQANEAMSRLKKEIRNQVRSVYLDIRTQKKVIQQLEEQVKAARRNYQQVNAQFEQGLVTAVDQVDAFTALNEAENRLAQAYYSYQLDQIRLELAMGTFQTDLAAKELPDDETY